MVPNFFVFGRFIHLIMLGTNNVFFKKFLCSLNVDHPQEKVEKMLIVLE
jgi:hypothetical protein